VPARVPQRHRARAGADLEHVFAVSRLAHRAAHGARPRHARGLGAARLLAGGVGQPAGAGGGAVEPGARTEDRRLMTATTAHDDDRIVTAFTACAVLWTLVGMAAGVYAAAELVWPGSSLEQPWL